MSEKSEADRAIETETLQTPPMGLGLSAALFGGGAVLLAITTRVLIPTLSERLGVEPIVFWFLLAGGCVFLPLLVASAVCLHREGAWSQPGCWSGRLRFRRMNAGDWAWSLSTLVAIGVLSGVAVVLFECFVGEAPWKPEFMTFEPLTPGRYWLLALWLPYWLLNILGEEILWRGVMLPRQETAFGRWAWLVNGAGWALFHVPFGWPMLVTLVPILVLLPWVTQRRKNSWVGVVIHAGLNGPAFLCIAFGLLA